MSHNELPRVCTPEEFLAMSLWDRRHTLLKQITEYEELWHQKAWIVPLRGDTPYEQGLIRQQRALPPGERNICGTAHCVAGWISLLAGDVFISAGGDVRTLDNVYVHVGERATQLLGEEDSKISSICDDMFDVNNTLDQIREYIEDMDDCEFR